jgi:hypothetical protein
MNFKAENPEPVPPQIVINGQPGKPAGTKSGKQKTKKQTRVGGSEQTFSTSKLKSILISANTLQDKVESWLKEENDISELDEAQKEIAGKITEIIVANEPVDKWESKISEYINEPVDKNLDVIKEIQDIAYEHQVDDFMASVLYHSKI